MVWTINFNIVCSIMYGMEKYSNIIIFYNSIPKIPMHIIYPTMLYYI